MFIMTTLAEQHQFFQLVESDLKEIQTLLLEDLNEYDTTLIAAATHLMKAGGKRLRPTMALLTGQAIDESSYKKNRKSHLLLAIALEMLHTATLIHDDIIDESTLRRGIETVNNKWDNRTSVLTGDFLLARSCYYISLIGSTRLNKIFSQMVMDMCNGEISQFSRLFSPQTSMEEYYYRIECKTAILMATGCQGAAIINQSSETIEQSAYQYGRCLGIAFQIMDDILDFTSNDGVLGKPGLHDLEQGHITLPTLLTLKNSPDKQELENLINAKIIDQSSKEKAVQIILDSGSLKTSEDTANQYIKQAKESLDSLIDTPAKSALLSLADFIIARKS